MARGGRKPVAPLNRTLISLAVSSCFVVNMACANPTAPTVVHGTVSFQRSGNTLSITNSPQSIINWGAFSIQAHEITRFIQQSAASAVLNRVTGQDPSSILGTLQSNGRVFLINPNGILFGAGAQIDVAGLMASTLSLSNADFLAGRMRLTEVPGAGSIINQGAITSAQGGSVYLVAPNLTNSGVITSPKGEVVLAAGRSVELVDPATPNLRVEIVASDHEARNLGKILADSGRIGIYAGLINHGGTLRADTVETGRNGEILLRAQKNIALDAGSVITASGAPGGVHDGGTVRVIANDTLDMRPGSAVHVDGGVDGGNGGFLELSGRQQIALNGLYTGRARKDGYRHGSLLIDPLNINIGANGAILNLALPALGGGVGKMVVTSDGSRAYVMRPEYSSASTYIDVVDLVSNTVIASILLPSGTGETVADMVLSPDGSKLYAVGVNATPSSIFVIDANTASGTYNTVVASFLAGDLNTNPRAIAVSPDGAKLYVAHQNFVCSVCPAPPARISVLNASDGTQLGHVEVSGFPTQLLTNPVSQRLYVYNQGQLQEINTASDMLLGSTGVGTALKSMTLSADGTRLYLPFGDRVEVRDAATKAVVGTLPFGGDVLTVNSAGTRAYLAGGGAATVADIATNTAIQTFATGGTGNGGVGFVASTGNFYVTTQGTNTLSVINLNAGTDTAAGGSIAFGSAPGSTLSLPVSALNGAWSAIDLAATNNISVNAPILNSDLDPGTTLFKLSAGNDVNINAALGSAAGRFNRDIALRAGNNINVHGSIYQAAGRTLALDANVTDAGYGITASGAGSVNIKALGAPLVVDTLGSMTVSGQDLMMLGGGGKSVAVNVGGLFDANLSGNVRIQAGKAVAGVGQSVNSSVSLNANAINILATGSITIAGGDSGYAPASGAGVNAATATATATVAATTNLALSAGGALSIRGGDFNNAYASDGNNVATLNAGATVSAGGDMTFSAASITIRGGDGAEAYAGGNGNNTATVNANAALSAGGTMSMTAAGGIEIRGGDSASATGASAGVNSALTHTSAVLTAPAISMTGGAITIRGGDNLSASAYGAEGNNASTLNANAGVNASGNVSVSATSLTVRGGNNNSVNASDSGTHVGTLNANAVLSAGAGMTLSIAGPVLIAGGDNNYAAASSGANMGTLNANATVSAGGNLALTASSLTVRGGNQNSASVYSNGNNIATLNANAGLTAGQAMSLTVSGPVVIAGGDFNSASASSGGVNVAAVNANATVSAGTTLTLSAAQITVRGGDFADADASSAGNNTATNNANATLSAAGNMTLTATSGGILIRGGDSASASASSGGVNSATTNTNALVSSGGVLTVNATGGLTVRGGNNASASASDSGHNTALVNTNASLLGNTLNLTVAGPVLIQGGSNASAEASCCANSTTVNSATINANAKVRATGGLMLTVTGGGLTVAGGDGALAEPSEGSGQFFANVHANGELSAGGNLSINMSGGTVTVRGGDFASVYASASSAAAQISGLTRATGKIAAGGNLDIAASVLTVRGGDGAYINADGSGVASVVNANLAADGQLLAGGAISLNTGSLLVRGGNDAYATAQDSGQVNALITANGVVSAGTTLAITSTGAVSVAGGNNAAASASNAGPGGANTASVSAGALLAAGGNITVSASSLTVSGGVQPGFGAVVATGTGINAAATLANANIAAAGDFNYNGGSFALIGGVASTQGGVGSSGSTVAEANAGTQITGIKTLNIAGDLLILGGSAYDDGVDATNGIAMSRAILDPGITTISTLGDVMVTGGSVTGHGSAYSAIKSLGPVNLTIAGSSGLILTGGGSGSGVFADPASPVSITFSGGGVQSFVNNPLLDSASILTALFVPPPAPPTTGELPVNVELANQLLIISVNQSGSGVQVKEAATDAKGFEEEQKKKEKTNMVCR